MGHHGPQFRAKADLPVGFPYRFNSSYNYNMYNVHISSHSRRQKTMTGGGGVDSRPGVWGPLNVIV